MPPKVTAAPYLNSGRYWGRFSRFTDVGGKREPLVPEGATLATKDFEEACRLYAAREAHYVALRKRRAVGEPIDDPSPAAYAMTFLHALANKRNTSGALVNSAAAMNRRRTAIMHCLRTPAVSTVPTVRALGTSTMTRMIHELMSTPLANGEMPQVTTVRGWVMELSAMLSRAVFDAYLTKNPLTKHPDIPPAPKHSAMDESKVLFRDEARCMLDGTWSDSRSPWRLEITFTLAYTGGRKEEILGLRVSDIDFTRKLVRLVSYEPGTQSRNIKNKGSERWVPLWPRLAEVLADSLARHPRQGLLFPLPAFTGGPTKRATNILSALKSTAERVGVRKTMHHHIWRHTYATARLQMMARTETGAIVPVSAAIVAAELGHSTSQEIHQVYGHIVPEQVEDFLLDYKELPITPKELVRRDALRSAFHSARTANGRQHAKRRGAQMREVLADDKSKAHRRRIASKIRELAREQGWTPSELATAIDASDGEAQAIMGGDLSRISIERITALLQATERGAPSSAAHR